MLSILKQRFLPCPKKLHQQDGTIKQATREEIENEPSLKFCKFETNVNLSRSMSVDAVPFDAFNPQFETRELEEKICPFDDCSLYYCVSTAVFQFF